VQVQGHVGIVDVHVGAGAQRSRRASTTASLDLEGGEPECWSAGVVVHGRADGEGVARVEVLSPVDGAGPGVQALGVSGLEGAHLEEHAHAPPAT
jgi:hypothetical protein